MKSGIILSFFVIFSLISFSQESLINWNIEQSRQDDGSYVLTIKADIPADWYIYGMNMDEGGPLPLFIGFEDSENLIQKSDFSEIKKAKTMYDDVFGMDVMSYSDKVEIKCVFVPKPDITSINLIIDGQACNKKDGSCMQVYESLPIEISK
jgi:hypothetical protein